MTSILNFPAPNIVPGLNLSADTFAGLYAWIGSIVADSTLATRLPFQYGLLASSDGQSALILEKNGPEIALIQCLAITSAGSLVGHFEQLHLPLRLDLTTENLRPQERYAILVEVDRSAQCVFGPESSDRPLRPLYVRPAYGLRLQAYDRPLHRLSDALCIGVLEQQSGEWQLAEYIPPCLHIAAEPNLLATQRKYVAAINDLTQLLPKIVLTTDTHQLKPMLELRELALQLGSFLSFHTHRYLQLAERGNPFDLFDLWIGIAGQISFLLKCLQNSHGFYQLLQHNTKRANGTFFTPETWNAAIQQLAVYQYDHQDIKKAVETTTQFIDTVIPIFKALAFVGYTPLPDPIIADKKTASHTNW